MPADGEAAAGKTNFASMLTSLHIQNFRAFRDLKLDGLGRINLIAGGNNVGKTALLECLLLSLFDPQNGQLRELPKQFRTSANNTQGYDYWDWAIPMPRSSNVSLFEIQDTVAGKQLWKFSFGGVEPSEGYNYHLGRLGRSEVWLSGRPRPNCPKWAVFSTFPADPIRDAFDYNRVILKKRKSRVDDLLAKVEPRLAGIESIQVEGLGPMLYAEIGLPELIPVTQLGQGFNRLLDIYSELVAEEAKVLLIDEIENGLYWKALPIVWKGLFAAARELDVQIFATTHSLECIKAADEAARAEGSYDLALVRLDRVGDDIKPTVMGEEAMRTAREFGWEIR